MAPAFRQPDLPSDRPAAADRITMAPGAPGAAATPASASEPTKVRAEVRDIGERVQRLIDESGFASQAAFARAIGVGVDTINHWVNNRRQPRRSSLTDVARVLGLPPASVFAFVERGVPLPRPPRQASVAPLPAANTSQAPPRGDGAATAGRSMDSAAADVAWGRVREGATSPPRSADAEHAARLEALRGARAGRHPEGVIPLINRVAAGGPFEAHDLDEAIAPDGLAHPVDYVDRAGVSDDPAFAFTVQGDSMTPLYQPGDVCICSGTRPIESGCDCFVRFTSERDDECTFKRVYFAEGGSLGDAEEGRSVVILQPLNPAHPTTIVPREHIAQVWPVVELRRRVPTPDPRRHRR